MTIEVEFFDEEDRMVISWDSEDPLESMLNDFTEEDFLKIFLDRAKEVLGNDN